jgi:uncharacterized membrane protein
MFPGPSATLESFPQEPNLAPVSPDLTPAAAPNPAELPPRLTSVDQLRGLVMVLMVLDHTREFFGNYGDDPVNLATTTVPLFFTRWVTHFCAPVFVFLAGTGAYLSLARGKSRPEQAAFLATRGLWLMTLELTLVKLGWTFSLDYSSSLAQVIWVIGESMIVLAALIFLPVPLVGALGVGILVSHNLFDGAIAHLLPSLGAFASILRPRLLTIAEGRSLIVAYPLLPWLGVIAAGYGFGPMLLAERPTGRRMIMFLGAVLLLAFVVLRAFNLYGDPKPWSTQEKPYFTALSFLNCEKYPPSLLFLLMTLGPALMMLAWFDGRPGVIGARLVTFGRVPLLYYLLQWPLVHALAILVAMARGEPVGWFFKDAPFNPPTGYGHGLPFIYLMWGLTVALLYFPSRWFSGLKRRRREAWLSYF